MILNIDYPPYMANLNFVASIVLITVACYYFNIQKLPKKAKYIFTAICILILMLIPVPYFMEDRNFGAIPIGYNDFRAYIPFTLVFLIIILLKFFSIQFEIIQQKREIPPLKFVLLFMFVLPHYVYNYPVEGPKDINRDKNRSKNLKRACLLIFQIFVSWFLLNCIFNFIRLPQDLFVTMFKGHWALPIIIGVGFTVVLVGIWTSALLSLASSFYNILGGYKFMYYQDKAFLATSIGEFWRRWNLWGNEWFFTYLYKPLRRKFKLSASMANIIIFTFSALIHAYVVLLFQPEYAWLIFFVFFINGVAVNLEAAAAKRFPLLSKTPVSIKFILTTIFVVISLGLIGLCFS
jgi:hypothetical protein